MIRNINLDNYVGNLSIILETHMILFLISPATQSLYQIPYTAFQAAQENCLSYSKIGVNI